MKIKAYGIPDDANNHRVEGMLLLLKEPEVEWIICPPGTKEMYRMPFIESENGRYFGVEGITRFVGDQLK